MVDFLIWVTVSPQATITGVVRHWHEESPWLEFGYVVGCVILYLHFFRGWPV